jgi:hypothetical protein
MYNFLIVPPPDVRRYSRDSHILLNLDTQFNYSFEFRWLDLLLVLIGSHSQLVAVFAHLFVASVRQGFFLVDQLWVCYCAPRLAISGCVAVECTLLNWLRNASSNGMLPWMSPLARTTRPVLEGSSHWS